MLVDYLNTSSPQVTDTRQIQDGNDETIAVLRTASGYFKDHYKLLIPLISKPLQPTWKISILSKISNTTMVVCFCEITACAFVTQTRQDESVNMFVSISSYARVESNVITATWINTWTSYLSSVFISSWFPSCFICMLLLVTKQQ